MFMASTLAAGTIVDVTDFWKMAQMMLGQAPKVKSAASAFGISVPTVRNILKSKKIGKNVNSKIIFRMEQLGGRKHICCIIAAA